MSCCHYSNLKMSCCHYSKSPLIWGRISKKSTTDVRSVKRCVVTNVNAVPKRLTGLYDFAFVIDTLSLDSSLRARDYHHPAPRPPLALRPMPGLSASVPHSLRWRLCCCWSCAAEQAIWGSHLVVAQAASSRVAAGQASRGVAGSFRILAA